ncbi:MAG TPA: hypothetical protein VG456_20065 [Candidatus Sulfopaludibacter sp.]|jgi:hypothetical protein|nr:hypothetical protein [Candidatus Sulfopaludibacter sp.]
MSLSTGLRFLITALTVLYLAFAAQLALSYMVTSPDHGNSSFELQAVGQPATPGKLQLLGLVVDQHELRYLPAAQQIGWTFDTADPASYVMDDASSAPAALKFQGHRFFALLHADRWSGVIRVLRNGSTVREVNLAPHDWRSARLLIEDPAAPVSVAVLMAGLVVFGGCALWFGPIRPGRPSLTWLVFVLGVVHLLYWASHPVATNPDSFEYLRQAPNVAKGIGGYFPLGYPLLLWLVGSVAGGHLGLCVTLLQHAMTVLIAVWCYRLLRLMVSEELALAGAILMGVLPSAMTVPQIILSETATSFAMVGAIYYAVRAARSRVILLMILSGLLMGWAGTLRVVPLLPLAPAVACIYLWSRLGLGGKRLAVTATAAGGVMLASIVWTGVHSGQWALATSGELHLYNRVVIDQKLVNPNGPATLQLQSLMGGRAATDFIGHWAVRDQPGLRALGDEESRHLLGRVAMEAILQHPARFLAYTPYLAARTLAAPTEWVNLWPGSEAVSPSLENSMPLPMTTLSWYWPRVLDAANRVIWPGLCFAAAIGAAIGLRRGRRRLILAMALVPAGYMLASAFVEYYNPRFNAPIVPFVVALAMLPLDYIYKRLKRPPLLERIVEDSREPVAGLLKL